MTADEEEQQSTAGPSWLHRLYRFETGFEDSSSTSAEPPAYDPPTRPDSRSHPPSRSGPSASPPRSEEHGPGPNSETEPSPSPSASGGPPAVSGRSASASDRSPSSPARSAAEPSPSPVLAALRRAADVEDLRVVGRPEEHPYGRTVRVSFTTGVERRWGTLRLFRRPSADEDGFEAAIGSQLDRWADASDVPGVVPVVDAATCPRPWTVTAPLDDGLSGARRRSPSGALRDARALARTLVALHDRGVVHAGLDPDTVVYHTDPDAGVVRPRLDLPGLIDVYRRYADPAGFLDPRFAPPEYFDSDLGVVDRTTDVYGLGAVLFWLLTGRPPYVGDPVTIRDAVVDESVPAPSAIDPRIPESVDDLVVRAMQPAPFDRFETASALLAAVDEVCRRVVEQ